MVGLNRYELALRESRSELANLGPWSQSQSRQLINQLTKPFLIPKYVQDLPVRVTFPPGVSRPVEPECQVLAVPC